jgi:hypothetical protein
MTSSRKRSFPPCPHEASVPKIRERTAGSISTYISSDVMRQSTESPKERTELIDGSIQNPNATLFFAMYGHFSSLEITSKSSLRFPRVCSFPLCFSFSYHIPSISQQVTFVLPFSAVSSKNQAVLICFGSLYCWRHILICFMQFLKVPVTCSFLHEHSTSHPYPWYNWCGYHIRL